MDKKIGLLYFYIHFVVEVICFYYLSSIIHADIVWLIPLIYDGLAFVPQSIIGYISDKYPKINMGLIGIFILLIGFIIFIYTNINIYVSLILICLGNAFVHISGAEDTIKNSNGKLSSSAIFVSGGSFGLITGKLIAKTSLNPIFLILLILTTIPFILLSKTYPNSKTNKCPKFDYINNNINKGIIIFLAVMIVIVRGYMGYGIPTSWNKTVLQTILLYVTMGLGKALGGILSDKFGIKKVAILSTTLAIPFLCFGDNIMILSLIGVMLFSMTMSITLAILVSCLNENPGLAFGLTTIGLFLGTLPIFFINIENKLINIIFITVISLICTFILSKILKEDKHEQYK